MPQAYYGMAHSVYLHLKSICFWAFPTNTSGVSFPRFMKSVSTPNCFGFQTIVFAFYPLWGLGLFPFLKKFSCWDFPGDSEELHGYLPVLSERFSWDFAFSPNHLLSPHPFPKFLNVQNILKNLSQSSLAAFSCHCLFPSYYISFGFE